MAKKKTSGADDLLDAVSMLPWWAGVIVAIVIYVVLHRLASPVAATAMQTSQLGDFVVRSMVAGLASAAQYVLPVICLGGAGVSFWRRRQRQALVADVAQATSADALDGMTWREFEMLVGEAFRLQGYTVAETGGGGADSGVDLVLKKGNEKFFVQCKQWKAFKVGVEVVRELYGVMAARGATGGFVVTSGRFTADAQAFTEGRNFKLIDGPRLLGLIKQAQQSLSSGSKATPKMPAAAEVLEPQCPVCASAMVRRRAKNGANAGAQFWGCARYPGCRGTRQMA